VKVIMMAGEGMQKVAGQALFDFRGVTVLITGGTRNLGGSFARAFASAGARVALLGGTDQAALEQTLSQCGGADAGHVGRLVDLADPSGVADVAAWAQDRVGPLDVLVNNAVVRAHGGLGAADVSLWDSAMAVNVRAPFLLAQALMPAMADRGYGRVINISGLAASWGSSEAIALGASQAALDGLTRSLAAVSPAFGVTVNSLMCGFVESEAAEGAARREAVRRLVPAGRFATHAEVVDVGLFLCTESASYVTGQTIVVAGGAGSLSMP
jgi:NAD(P)-dependent dehydrogenase (short-subunit alcohol dehydrogenase family)